MNFDSIGKRSVVSWRLPTTWVGILAGIYVAVLPMSGTIALRNVVLVTLLILVVKGVSQSWRELSLSVPVLLWATYLVLFPLFATDHAVAWQSFAGQWARGLLAMLVGAGVAVLLAEEDGKKGDVAFLFGLASAVPLLIHLGLIGMTIWSTSSIPLGNWGREKHHADLGYAAGQAILLLSAAILTGNRKVYFWSVTLIALALLSVLVALSRAGVLFGVLAGVLAFGAASVAVKRGNRRRNLWGVLVILILGSIVLAVAVKTDPRWEKSITQVATSWKGSAIQMECQGVGLPESAAAGNPGARDLAPPGTPRVLAGDGSRIILLRSGFELALEFPWGLDGSRQAYQKRLQQVCPNPVFLMAHTHNGWLDTALALGWIGAALYLWVLVHFLRMGYTYLRTGQTMNPWAPVLIAASLFWILRGLTDSVFRDHMLEMQGFVLAYAAVALKIQKGGRPSSLAGPTVGDHAAANEVGR